jgi:tRNA modification GTPase
MHTDDTIVAISTPAGRGGIGVVRLSGDNAAEIAQKVLRTPRDRNAAIKTIPLTLKPWNVCYAELPDEQGEVVDQVLVSYFQKPRSYTAEDVVEISCHGAPVVLQYLVGRCIHAGARLAEPGEFTMRAFLNGRIDLTQAEAVRDLIEARTLYQAKVAAGQMEGAVSHRLAPVKKQLVDLISLLEAGIDFAEDDVSVLSQEQIAGRMAPVVEELSRLETSFSTGKLIHEGLTLAIVGRPNVGKSSLFNCLLGQDRAIVTAAPGTTRDLVAETVEIDGIPLRFVDTAGVRHAFDEAESIGVRKSYEAAAESDLALLVLNGAEGLLPDDHDLLRRLAPLGKVLIVVNKADLPQRLNQEELRKEVALAFSEFSEDKGSAIASESLPIILISALKSAGIDELRRAIVATALPGLGENRESGLLTNLRQEALVRDSLRALASASRAQESKIPHEMLLLDLYAALRPLDAITGQTTIEDILGNIFSTFCIGK